MVKELKPDNIGISISYPLPGTKFYEKVKDDLLLKANCCAACTTSEALMVKLFRFIWSIYL
jgi:hypothetical protein